MKELVGTCSVCNEKVYCDSGFLKGEHINGQLICHACLNSAEK